MMLTSKIPFASLAIEHHFAKEKQRRIQRCVETWCCFLYEREAGQCENQQRPIISICACWADRRLSGFCSHKSFAICISSRDQQPAFELLTGQRCKRKLHLWGSPPVTFFSAGHNEFYFIVRDLEKSSSFEKQWINTSEVWRGAQMLGNKKYKRNSKVAWSLLLFKRPNNLGTFVT